MTYLDTKDGVKKVNYFDPKLAAKALTPQGWERYCEGQVVRLQDFKVSFLERLLKGVR